jgi:hypothetical protein
MRIFGQLISLLAAILLPGSATGQLIFSGPAQFGDRVGTGLFISQNGQVAQFATGFVEHNFPAVSRDNRFVVFSSPDGVTAPLQVPPSSDIYVFDRATNQTRRVVDHNTMIVNPSEVDTFIPTSAVMSPNNQVIAHGVTLTRRQGTANPRSTKELNIVRASDGLILANPTFGRGPVSDAFEAEFVGISWDPGGNSFVTPNYVTVAAQAGGQVQLPAIVRYAVNPQNGTWGIAGVLSTPQYFNNQFPIAASVHIYPAISPSGAGLAYFSLTWPDALGSSQAVVARLIIANADGSNARVLTTFDQGTYPGGLAWAPDGNSLVISIAPQLSTGVGFLPLADGPNAVLRSVSTTNGQVSQIPGLNAGFFPSFGVTPFVNSGSLNGVRLRVDPDGAGGFLLRATGVEPDKIYFLQSSPTLEGGSFGPTQSFPGQQLLAGIPLDFASVHRFFRLVN